MPGIKLSTLCYLERDGKYLMLHRTKKENDENGGKWIGVGGKFDKGESPEECMLREVREETGLTVTRCAFRGIVTFVSDVYGTEYMHLFTADRWEGEEHVCDEGDLAWVETGKVPSLPLWAGDRIFLSLLEEGTPFFSLKLIYRGDDLVRAILDGRELPL